MNTERNGSDDELIECTPDNLLRVYLDMAERRRARLADMRDRISTQIIPTNNEGARE